MSLRTPLSAGPFCQILFPPAKCLVLKKLKQVWLSPKKKRKKVTLFRMRFFGIFNHTSRIARDTGAIRGGGFSQLYHTHIVVKSCEKVVNHTGILLSILEKKKVFLMGKKTKTKTVKKST